MRRVYRENRKKGVIILKGTKYLFIATVILFIATFALTRLTQPKAIEAEPEETTVSTVYIEPEPEVKVEIDNEWALFLVNNQNPLPDNYDSIIDTTLVYTSWREYYMDSRMADYMKRMIEDAADDGINLEIVSAYRTIEYQQQNFDNSYQQP